MSDQAPQTPQALPPGVESQVDEVIEWRRLVLLAGASLVLFAVGIVYALWLLNHDTGAITQRGMAPPPVLVGCKEDPNLCAQVGLVEQRQIPLEQRAVDMRRAADARLGTYGWIDQPNKVAHIPIGEAMQKLSAGERPAVAPSTPLGPSGAPPAAPEAPKP